MVAIEMISSFKLCNTVIIVVKLVLVSLLVRWATARRDSTPRPN